MKEFCRAVVSEFKEQFLRRPTGVKIIRIEHQFAEVGFLRFFGCIDCSSCVWWLCPKAEHDITVAKDKVLCLKMEVVCDLDMKVWSLFCGLSGMLNDINILYLSLFFSEVMKDAYPSVLLTYTVGARRLSTITFF